MRGRLQTHHLLNYLDPFVRESVITILTVILIIIIIIMIIIIIIIVICISIYVWPV